MFIVYNRHAKCILTSSHDANVTFGLDVPYDHGITIIQRHKMYPKIQNGCRWPSWKNDRFIARELFVVEIIIIHGFKLNWGRLTHLWHSFRTLDGFKGQIREMIENLWHFVKNHKSMQDNMTLQLNGPDRKNNPFCTNSMLHDKCHNLIEFAAVCNLSA